MKPLPITNFVKRAAKHSSPPIDAGRLRKRARLGEIEHYRYEQYVNLYNSAQVIQRERKAKTIMLWITISACVIFFLSVAIFGLRSFL